MIPLSDRIIYVVLNSTTEVTIIAAYAPTGDDTGDQRQKLLKEQEKQQFYDSLTRFGPKILNFYVSANVGKVTLKFSPKNCVSSLSRYL